MRSTILLLFFQLSMFAQTDMTPGFALLENGKLAEAEVFFTRIVEELPLDKTANICLGRAIGLNGKPESALQIFNDLDQHYPNDFEIGLNKAEAYLWNNSPKESLEIYQELLLSDSLNFTANLGTANSHFQLTQYDSALYYISKALSIDPENEGAANSKKYILLALAQENQKGGNYDGAIQNINQILEKNEKDREALLNKGIVFLHAENYQAAKEVFLFLNDQNIDPLEANILLSHTSMLKQKSKDAVSYAKKAMEYAKENDYDQLLRSGIQKINALGAAKKFAEAQELIAQLTSLFGEQEELELASARLIVWDREPKKGLEQYNRIEENSEILLLGKTEAYMAMKQWKNALMTIDSALVLNPTNPDALKLKSQIQDNKRWNLEVGGNHSDDVGQNQAYETYLMLQIPAGERNQFFVRSQARRTLNNPIDLKADQIQLVVGDRIMIHRLLNLNVSLGTSTFQNNNGDESFNYLAKSDLTYQFTKNQSLSIGYFRESLSYSSDNIRSGVQNNRFHAAYQYTVPKGIGFYGQYGQSYLSDGNESYNAFASLFYEVSSFPMLKVGVNANYLSFAKDESQLYFSPDSYVMGEAFLHFGNNYDNKSKLTYSILFGAGKQSINSQELENIQRLDLQVGYRFFSKYHLTAGYFTNSAANSTTIGHSFQRYSLKLNVVL